MNSNYFLLLLVICSFFTMQSADSVNGKCLTTIPHDIINEIDNYLFDGRLNLPAAIAAHDALFSINKEMRAKKPSGKEQLKQQLELVQQRFNIHPLLALAYIDKNEWINEINSKIASSIETPLKDIFKNNTEKNINTIEGKLAVLIRQARRIRGLYPNKKTINIHQYLQERFGNTIAASRGILTEDDSLIVIDEPESDERIMRLGNDPIVFFRNTERQGYFYMFNGNMQVIDGKPLCFTEMDIFQHKKLFLLTQKHNQQESSIFSFDTPGEVLDFISLFNGITCQKKGTHYEWILPKNLCIEKHINDVIIREDSFAGKGVYLGYDTVKEAIKVFDDHDQAIYSLPETSLEQ